MPPGHGWDGVGCEPPRAAPLTPQRLLQTLPEAPQLLLADTPGGPQEAGDERRRRGDLGPHGRPGRSAPHRRRPGPPPAPPPPPRPAPPANGGAAQQPRHAAALRPGVPIGGGGRGAGLARRAQAAIGPRRVCFVGGGAGPSQRAAPSATAPQADMAAPRPRPCSAPETGEVYEHLNVCFEACGARAKVLSQGKAAESL